MAVVKTIEDKCPRAQIFYIGSHSGIESKIVPRMGIEYYGISTGKFRRYHKSKILNLVDPTTILSNIKDLVNFLKGIFEAISILKNLEPDVVFAKGGFVSLPVAYAAKHLGVSVINHESDVVMGLANRKISKFAHKVCVSFPEKNYKNFLNPEKIVETGNPVREDIIKNSSNRDREKNYFGLKGDKMTLLVLGGSQGSRFINDLILEILDSILDKWQLIWVTGEKDFDRISRKTNDLDQQATGRLKLFAFISNDIADAYRLADLVISRAGSNVLFELAVMAKPAILIPYDVSAGSHQLANAKVFSRAGAAYLFREKNLCSKKLLHQLNYLFENKPELEAMGRAIKSLADINASKKIAKEIIEIGEINNNEKNRENKKRQQGTE